MLNPNNLRRFVRVLLLGNLAIFGILVLTMAFALHSSRQAYSERAQQAAENLARTLSLGVGAEIRQIDNALLSATLQFRRLTDMGKLTPPIAARIADELKAQIPQADTLRLTDANGLVLNGGTSASVSIADRNYFKQAQDNPDSLVISEPIQGRIIQKWGIALARARLAADGSFAGVVYANLSSDHFLDMFDDYMLGPQGAVTLRSDTLKLIARFSAAEKIPDTGIGTSNVSAELRAAMATNAERGFFVTRTALDGIERATAYQRVPGLPLIVLVGLGTDDFYAPWRKQVMEIGGLTALLAAMVAGLSVLFYTRQGIQLRSKEESAKLAAEREALLQSGLVSMAKVKDRTVLWHNQAMCNLFGYGPNELLGQSARILYMDDESYEQVGNAYKILREGGQLRTQLQMRHRDGSKFWVDLSGASLPGNESM